VGRRAMSEGYVGTPGVRAHRDGARPGNLTPSNSNELLFIHIARARVMPVSTRRRAREAPQSEGTQSETRAEKPPAKRVKRAHTQAQNPGVSQSSTPPVRLATWADAGTMQLRDGEEGRGRGGWHTLLGAVMDHLKWDREESSAVRQVGAASLTR
jgi:hypothetical protein